MKRRVVMLASAALSLFIVVGYMVVGRGVNQVTAATISEANAVALATQYAQGQLPAGWLNGMPTQANGKVMARGDAMKLGMPTFQPAGDTSNLVWLIFLQGDVVASLPSIPNQPQKPAARYQQMSVILDASNGQLLASYLFPPAQEIRAASALPSLAIPTNIPISPPVITGPTTVPLTPVPNYTPHPGATSTPIRASG